LPHTNILTVTGNGHSWVDQQWLGQLILYGLHSLGGVRLLLGVNFVLVVGGYVAAMVYATRRGASPGMVAAVATVAFLPTILASAAVRTQSFAYLMFVGMSAVLLRRVIDLRRALALLALLAVWANLHGSVVLA